MAGVGVIDGVRLADGVTDTEGVTVLVGVKDGVGEGGKNLYATGSAKLFIKYATPMKTNDIKISRQPRIINSRRFLK